MKVLIFAIRDVKAAAYLRPFFSQNHQVAMRDCTSACRNPESPFVKFPTDFELYQLGEFDDESGLITTLKHPTNLGTMHQFLPESAADTAA